MKLWKATMAGLIHVKRRKKLIWALQAASRHQKKEKKNSKLKIKKENEEEK